MASKRCDGLSMFVYVGWREVFCLVFILFLSLMLNKMDRCTSGPNFMGLLTISIDRRLRKQGILCLRQAYMYVMGYRRIMASACANYKLLGVLGLQGESWSEVQNSTVSRAMKLGPHVTLRIMNSLLVPARCTFDLCTLYAMICTHSFDSARLTYEYRCERRVVTSNSNQIRFAFAWSMNWALCLQDRCPSLWSRPV